jgi:predicted dehydrogenase
VVINPSQETATCDRLNRIKCKVYPEFDALMAALRHLRLDLCIVPSPIHLHTRHAVALLAAGVHVLVEKPLAATVGEVNVIQDAAEHAGRLAAVGFQYLHAAEVRALKQRLLAGEIGALQRISVYAAWPRSHAYYRRNEWAGRLRIEGGWVLDSPVANAMAHFFLLLLFLSGNTPDGGAKVRKMSAELYRAQDIESFDTAVVSMVTEQDCVLNFYGTHSSREVTRPILVIEGARGRAEWRQDSHASSEGVSGRWRQEAALEAVTRERMLRDVLARLTDPQRFVCTPELAREHVRCVNALHELATIRNVPAEFRSIRQENEDIFTYVEELDEKLARAFLHRGNLVAGDVAWAVPPREFDLRNYPGIGAVAARAF